MDTVYGASDSQVVEYQKLSVKLDETFILVCILDLNSSDFSYTNLDLNFHWDCRTIELSVLTSLYVV